MIAFVQDWSLYANVGGIWITDVSGEREPLQLTDMDVNASDLMWSPSGDLIFFLSSQGERDIPSMSNNLWAVNPVDGSQQQLTRNLSLGADPPAWSGDGNWMLFAAVNLVEDEESRYDLWMLSADGNEIRRLTDDIVLESSPQWSQSNDKIVFRDWGVGLVELDTIRGAQTKILDQNVPFLIVEWYNTD